MDAVEDGTLPPDLAGELVLLVAAWVDPEAGDETACREANRRRRPPRHRRRAGGRAGRTGAAAGRPAARGAEPVLRRLARMRIASVETRTLPPSLRPSLPGRVGSRAASLAGRDAGNRDRRRRHAPATPAAATGCPTRELLERLLVGVDPRAREVVRAICETVDFHGGRPWAVEVAVLGPRRVARLGQPLWQLLGGRAASGWWRTRRLGELAGPGERARRAAAAARPRRAGDEDPLPPRRLARRRGGGRGGARRGRRRHRAHGRRQPGLAHGRATWRRAGTSPPPRPARGR